jgi:transposase-like protein
MRRCCPNPNCKSDPSLIRSESFHDPRFRPIIRKGAFYRARDRRFITKYFCKQCGRNFSSSTLSPDYRQKKRDLNPIIVKQFASGTSQRRLAILLQVNPKTIVRKFRIMAARARKEHEDRLRELVSKPLTEIQFDDLETFEHTKCKPLSVSLAVDKKTREIISFQVSRMPASGRLAEISRRKYGYRKDERGKGWDRLFRVLGPITNPDARLESDQNPHYPRFLRRHLSQVQHVRHPGARGAITGQGELKKLVFDPLFALNHTCAMLRANLNRLFRRTWCTTKTLEGLIDHLSIYLRYHNTVLIHPKP